MFTQDVNVMLYVDDTKAEKAFWEAVGFSILREEEVMGYLTFDMKSSPESTLTMTVFDRAFILQVSPEVVDNQPSVLFKATNIEELHAKVKEHALVCNDITDVPFKNFNFASPSGQYYAVAAV